MKLQFNVTACWGGDNEHTAISGSVPELGSWNAPAKAFELQLLGSPTTESQPAVWIGTLEITEASWQALVAAGEAIEYKVVHWKDSTTPPPGPPKFKSCVWGPSAFGKSPPPYIAEPQSKEQVYTCRTVTDEMLETLVWEEGNLEFSSDQVGNRQLHFGDLGSDSVEGTAARKSEQLVHYIDLSGNLLADGETYGLPFIRSRKPASGDLSRGGFMSLEAQRTTCYYESLRAAKSMHYNRIWDRIVVGTCPRSEEQITKLRDEEKITDILNFQTAEDIKNNLPTNVANRLGTSELTPSATMQAMFATFTDFGMRYSWLPTFDMDSSARSQALASAVFTLAGLLLNPACTGVYVHCSAGVGRSISCVAGFFHCCLQMPPRDTQLVISTRRSVAFFDHSALVAGAADFAAKFQPALQLMLAQHGQLLRAPQIGEAYVAATRRGGNEGTRRGSDPKAEPAVTNPTSNGVVTTSMNTQAVDSHFP